MTESLINRIKKWAYNIKENSIIINLRKKFWIGLAIVFFVVAGLVAYTMIWVDLTPRDKPLFLLSNTDKIQLPNFIYTLKNGNITNASPEDFGEYLRGKKNLTLNPDGYIMCKPESEVFLENSYITCDIPFLDRSQVNSTPSINELGYIEISAYSIREEENTKYYMTMSRYLRGNVFVCRYNDLGGIQQDCWRGSYTMSPKIRIPTLNNGLQKN